MIPIVPLLVIVPLGLAGIPLAYTALIPVPLMCLLLGWSLHNDTAYDNTAIWLHVVSGVRGASDRVGRLVPVLIAGILVIGLGSAVTVFVLDDWRLLPSLVGVSTALLLGGLGVGSITSARFPYPAVKPGDSPFQQPQSTGADHGARAVDHDVRIAARRRPGDLRSRRSGCSRTRRGTRPRSPRASGSASSCSSLGVLLGGRVFDRRGPEIVGAALRA